MILLHQSKVKFSLVKNKTSFQRKYLFLDGFSEVIIEVASKFVNRLSSKWDWLQNAVGS